MQHKDEQLIIGFSRDSQRRGLSPGTIAARSGQLRRFLLDNPEGFRSVSREQIERWLDRKTICSKTRATYISCLKAFYGWSVEVGELDLDPARAIRSPKLRRNLPRPIATKDLETAVAAADPQMLCWLLLGSYQGLRCQEIAGLRREDVVIDAMTLRVVKGKGGKERLLPLHPKVLIALQMLPMPPAGPLFTRPVMRDEYPPSELSSEINDFLHELGIADTAHSLRHWFGTKAYEVSGADIRLVQELLGHDAVTSTAIYTAFYRPNARKAVEGLSISDGLRETPQRPEPGEPEEPGEAA